MRSGSLMILVSLLWCAPCRADVLMSELAPHPGVTHAALLVRDHLLVTEGGYGKIQVIPLADPSARFDVETGRLPFTFAAMGDRVLVSNCQDERLTVLGPDFRVEKQVDVPLGVTGLAVREGDVLGVLATDNAVLPLRRPSLDAMRPIEGFSGPWRIAATRDRVVVMNHRHMLVPDDDQLVVLDREMTPLKVLDVGGGTRDIGAAPDGLVWVTLATAGRVIAVDPVKPEIVGDFAAGENPSGLGFLENLVLVVSAGDHTITVIDTPRRKVYTTDLNRFGLAIRNPRAVVPSADGTLFLVAEGAVTSLRGFLARRPDGAGWEVSAEALAGDGREPVHGSRGPGAEVVGIAGKALYPAAAGIMATRHKNKPTRSLSEREKRSLRPVFGSLVERVRLTWEADPMDEWGDIQLGSTIGQTYGMRIYLREPDPGTWSRDTLALVIHEMVHSRQYEQAGGWLPGFGYQYFKNWALAGYSYERHPMEIEADRVAQQALAGAWSIYAGAPEPAQDAR